MVKGGTDPKRRTMENQQRAVVLANGTPPSRMDLVRAVEGASVFVCADGGANTAADFGLEPDLIIGDLDSIEHATLKVFAGVKTRRIADQNSTDLEKALTWLTRKGVDEIHVFGATGGRIDHTVGNLSGIAKFERKAKITVFDNDGRIQPVLAAFTLNEPAGTVVSLIPLTLCEGVITTGLKWNLKYESLAMGVRDGTSNVVTSSPATIKVRRGTLFVFVRSGKNQ